LTTHGLHIWAVLNLTPDSFFQKSRTGEHDFVERSLQALQTGADVIDVGAESSRPSSQEISHEEEWTRLQPLLALKKEIGSQKFKQCISLDTYKPETAKKALELGAGIINDIRAGESDELVNAVATHKAKIVLMHAQGRPKNMQDNPDYDNVVNEVLSFLKERTAKCIDAGILPENIIWDPGIGFGKTLEHNLTLLKNVSLFLKESHKLMLGISRKSFIGKLLKVEDMEQRLGPTIAFHTYLALQGVDILRVHDVESALQVKKITKELTLP